MSHWIQHRGSQSSLRAVPLSSICRLHQLEVRVFNLESSQLLNTNKNGNSSQTDEYIAVANWLGSMSFLGLGKLAYTNKYTRSIDICPTLWALNSTAHHSVPSSLAYVFSNSMDSGFGTFPFFCASDYKLSIQRLLELPGVPVCNSVLMEMYSLVLGSSHCRASDRFVKQELN